MDRGNIKVIIKDKEVEFKFGLASLYLLRQLGKDEEISGINSIGVILLSGFMAAKKLKGEICELDIFGMIGLIDEMTEKQLNQIWECQKKATEISGEKIEKGIGAKEVEGENLLPPKPYVSQSE
jgi:hypothetical protein